MTARFTTDPPLASADTWVERQTCGLSPIPPQDPNHLLTGYSVPSLKRGEERAATREAKLEAIWRENMARRDAAAKEYGEPETPHEFYAGRPGSQAEKIVLDCLCKLEAIREPDRLYATHLTAAISHIYVWTSCDISTARRRAKQLLERSGESE